ncbi:Casein kinase II, regulatory subunit [Cordyceps fumosorosea ARSEF 2679]|uniref:Casein kinase II, regulatory subunit n=1 Tax=Cordyceps fumosorosea (strain ARSEF 2679) TaxID=1081104 RepID=A0A168BUK1_CORFA|nr:Casein kinase II, regulatory subunit [Cordyceps fumosorosea ARSEF 2679]OAA70568.1 Casein kinase II, regulatory subunit [Cordyceps fumosorosea ARSEF 2679]
MEQIETQASDLRFLSQAQVPLSNSPSVTYETPRLGPQQHASPGSASFGGNSATPGDVGGASAGKRKSTDDGQASAKQTRSKRNRYISIACNECKRRKIKCNGETPCKRCGNMGLNCLYTPNCCANTFKDSEEYKLVTSHLTALQDEVGALQQAMQAMQSMQPGAADRSHMMPSSMDRAIIAPSMIAPSPAQSSISGRQPSIGQARTPGAFRGSTSTSHMIGIAQTNTGIAYPDLQDSGSQIEPSLQSLPAGCDPILEYGNDEMLRLCQIHEDEIGIMYPVLNMGSVTEHARHIAAQFDALRHQPGAQLFTDDKTLELKMVLCCALVVEESGPCAKAQKLFDSMEPVLNRKLLAEEAYISGLPLLCIFAGYRFLTDDEGLAWRVIGQVCRLCLELGLHRSQVHQSIGDPIERQLALNSFWSAYVLDRRWAFNTGLPYVIQDADIDPKLDYPTEHPYLVSMISYSKLGAKVWSLVEQRRASFLDNDKPWIHDIQRLDAEIIAWYGCVPSEVQIRDWHEEGHINSTSSYNLQRLKVWTYLRKNQIRNWLHAPILHTTNSINGAPHLAGVCVTVAKDTVAYLHHVNRHTDMVRKSQAFYSQFLVSALAIMFLASTQAPAQFASTCREDFYTGLSLIEELSPQSHISKRLWRIVWSLRDYLQQLYPKQGNDAHSNAALGMIGLARGGRMDQPVPQYSYGGVGMHMGAGGPGDYSNGEANGANGAKLSSQLCDIYETFVTHNGFNNLRLDPNDMQTPDQARAMAQNQFYCTMRQMF